MLALIWSLCSVTPSVAGIMGVGWVLGTVTLFIKLSPDFSKARLPKQWIYCGSLPLSLFSKGPTSQTMDILWFPTFVTLS